MSWRSETNFNYQQTEEINIECNCYRNVTARSQSLITFIISEYVKQSYNISYDNRR